MVWEDVGKRIKYLGLLATRGRITVICRRPASLGAQPGVREDGCETCGGPSCAPQSPAGLGRSHGRVIRRETSQVALTTAPKA
jgi:hypothetical protein